MLLSLLAIAIIGLVAYFHFLEGFFSATISAILAVIAALVAIGCHEWVVANLLQGKIGEIAHSLVLVVLFAGTYLLSRVLFDKVVPGYVHVPLVLEKAGAAMMGVIAGVCAAGVFTIAAQAMPFGPSAAGFSRYTLSDPQNLTVHQQVPGVGARPIDAVVTDALKDETLKTGKHGLLIPVDSIVLGLISKVSGNGSLAGPLAFDEIHPDYQDELFFQRIGIQAGAKRVAVNTANQSPVRLEGLYSITTPLPQTDNEDPKTFPNRWQQVPAPTVRAEGGNIVLIVRVSFSGEAADSDNNVRLPPYSARVVLDGRNYYPIGTLDQGTAPFIRANRPDDFLVIPGGGVIDLVYNVPAEALGVPSDPRSAQPWAVTAGFFEAKRMGRIPLAGQIIKRENPGFPSVATVFRKENLPMPRGIAARKPPASIGGAEPSADSAASTANLPLENVQSRIHSQFLTPINVGRYDGVAEVTFNGGKATIKDKKFAQLELNPSGTPQGAPGVDYEVQELYVSEEKRAVQISGVVTAREGGDPWEWASKLSQFTLVDGGGGTYQPHGAWAKVKVGTADSLVARYNADAPVTQIAQSDARPTDVWIVFLIPPDTQLQELKFGETRVASVNLQVP